jgi:multiple sugar transport system substrate-binding protein
MEKRKLSRRDFLVAAAAAAGSAVLAACQGATPTPLIVKETVEVPKEVIQTSVVKETVSVKETVESVSVVTATPPPAKVTQILMWDDTYAPTDAGTPGAKVADAMYADFLAKHPEVTIDFQPITSGTEIRKAFIASHAAGNAPDLFYTYPPSMNPYWDQGFLLQMDDYVNNWQNKDKVVDALWYDALIDGHYFGIPCDFYGMCLVWRKDLFAAEGLTAAPKNWDELATFGQKLTHLDKKQYGFGLLGMAWASWYYENFVWQAGGEVTKRLPDKTVELSFTDDAGVQALQFYQDLKYKYKITQENVLQDYDANVKDFEAGRTTMWMSANTSAPGFINDGMTLDQLGYTTLPAGPTGVKAAQIGGGYWTINAAATKDRQDAAWTYAVWRTDPNTWVTRWQKENEFGQPPSPWLPVYKGLLNQAEWQDVPQEWVDASNGTAKIARTEYIFKDKLEPYFAAPVQTVLTDPTADCKAVLVEAAKKMAAEIEGTVLAASAK